MSGRSPEYPNKSEAKKSAENKRKIGVPGLEPGTSRSQTGRSTIEPYPALLNDTKKNPLQVTREKKMRPAGLEPATRRL